MLAWALRTVALAAKEGMAATKLDGLSALLRYLSAVLQGCYWHHASSPWPHCYRG
jgi:hypothetical protein